MIIGTHALLYSKDADADRAFFHDILGFRAVDAGEGWLILALPPAELGVHPLGEQRESFAEFYLMSDDIEREISALRAKGVTCSDVRQMGWGLLSTIELPSGASLGIYQPRHALAIE